jgi:uncharacterized protein YcnI
MRTTRLLTAVAGAAGLLVLLALPAAAHVTIPNSVEKGGDGVVTFAVPNEIDGASVTKIEIQMPKDYSLASVTPQAKAGWTVATTMRHLTTPVTADSGPVSDVVDTVTWSGGTIPSGQFDTFSLDVGPLPSDKDQLAFPAIQTYSNGTVVSWIDVTPAGGPEPDHPQPILHLVAAAGTTPTTVAAKSSSSSGKGLAAGALAVAIVALGVGGAAFGAARRKTAAT